MTSHRLCKLIYACAALFAGFFPLAAVAATSPTGQEPLLQQSDLKYQGAFRLPEGSTTQTTVAYGGHGLTYNPGNNSLFMLGHVWYQNSAEFSIPAIVNSSNLGDLSTATLLQPFADVTDGQIATISGGKNYVGGLLVHDNQLIGSAYTQVHTNQQASHFKSYLDLSLSNDFEGFYTVGTVGPRFVSGYMAHIPEEWQSTLGGPALTGGCCNTPDIGAINVNYTSWGPSAFVFNPDDLGVNNPVTATPLVYYSIDHPTLGDWDNVTTANPSFNLMTYVTGVVFPKGVRTVLFFGNSGTGIPCFGNGTDDPTLDHVMVNGVVQCYDPLEVDGGQGPHAYPYAYQVWAYDVLDLVEVKNGLSAPWEVEPYAVWTLNLPFDGPRRQIAGATYDKLTDSIYISQGYGDNFGMPVIHVFKVEVNSQIAPSPPSALQVE